MGYNIQQEQSFLADKLNQKVASNKLTIVDNPFIEKGHSSKLFDNDGFPVQKRNVITEGVINTFFYDWYYSQKMGVEPTTGGTTNLEFGQGSKSLVELMKTANRGILVTGFIGGNSNSTTGDFSIGIIGHLFENGIPVQPIAEMNIADNHLNFWNKLVETGNDPWQYGSWRMPSMLFENVVVAGK
jgi:PmbA protein